MIRIALSLFAVLIYSGNNNIKGATAFCSPSLSTRPSANKLPLTATKVETMESITIQEDDGSVTRIPVRGIERDEQNSVGRGSFKVDLIVPDDGRKAKGAAFFMHGFSQYPKAYRKTLKKTANDANIAIIAVETGVTSGNVLKDVLGGEEAQAVLQEAVSQDTEQCIRMVMKGKAPFAEYVGKNAPLGLLGHSMGAGLCFPLAAKFDNIKYVFTMAPAEGVPMFNPSDAISRRTVPNSIHVAGGWDIIAPAKKIETWSAESNQQKYESSLFFFFKRGLHTGFEDDLVLFNLNLAVSLPVLIPGLFDFFILQLLNLFRTNTGQLEATRTLQLYLFNQMVKGKKVTTEGALAAIENDPDIKDKWAGKVSIEYGKTKDISIGKKKTLKPEYSSLE